MGALSRTRGLVMLGVLGALLLAVACNRGGGDQQPTESAIGQQPTSTQPQPEAVSPGGAVTGPQTGALTESPGATSGIATEPREDAMAGSEPSSGLGSGIAPAPPAGTQSGGTTGEPSSGLAGSTGDDSADTGDLAADDMTGTDTVDRGELPLGGAGTGVGGTAPGVNVGLLLAGALVASAGVAALLRRGHAGG